MTPVCPTPWQCSLTSAVKVLRLFCPYTWHGNCKWTLRVIKFGLLLDSRWFGIIIQIFGNKQNCVALDMQLMTGMSLLCWSLWVFSYLIATGAFTAFFLFYQCTNWVEFVDCESQAVFLSSLHTRAWRNARLLLLEDFGLEITPEAVKRSFY